MSGYNISKSDLGYALTKKAVFIDDAPIKSMIFTRPYPEAPMESGFAYYGGAKAGVS